MSQEVQPQKSSFGSTVAGYMAFPAVSTTLTGISALKHGKGIKGAVKNMNIDGYKAINASLKNSGVDVFTRSQALALGHDTYKGFVKADSKLTKKLAKLDKKGLPLKEKFLNLFRKNKKTVGDLEAKYLKTYENAPENLANAKKAIKEAGENFSEKTAKNLDDVLKVDGNKFGKIAKETAEGAVKTGAKASAKGFGKYVKNNFKRELSWKHGKFNIIMTAVSFIPNVLNDVIPTFKEKGFKEGMKSVGKTLVKAGTDLVSYAAGGALGRAVGAAIGTVICPGAGSAVGAAVGDMIGSMVVGGTATSTMEKVLDGDKEEAVQDQIPQDQIAQNQIAQNQTIQGQAPEQITQTGNEPAQIAQNTQTNIENNNIQTDIQNSENQAPSFEEAKAGVTNAIEEKPKSRYIKPQNGVYHTAWVNELNKQKQQQALNYKA